MQTKSVRLAQRGLSVIFCTVCCSIFVLPSSCDTPTDPIQSDYRDYGEDFNNSTVNLGGPVDPSTIVSFPYQTITFYVEPLLPGLNYSEALVHREIVSAVQEWVRALASVGVSRSIVEVDDPSRAHWTFGFRDPTHRDQCDAGFRGGETLGHCFTYDNGCLAGSVHFNDSVAFTLNGLDEIGSFDLQTVALHEIGHLLGLAHTDIANHIMNAGYHGVVRRLSMQEAQDAALAQQ